MADRARKTALSILNTLERKSKTLDRILDDTLARKPELTRIDLNFVYALVYGVLRWRGRLDWIIDHFSSTRLHNIEPRVLNILRLGLFQIVFLDRIPASAAVNTSVELTKGVAAKWVAGFVNGLLRHAAREHFNVPLPDSNRHPVSALAVEKSLPEWLCKRWLDRFGAPEAGLLGDAVNTIPPITLRTNTLKATRNDLVESLKGACDNVRSTRFSPDGVSFFNPKTPIGDLDAFDKGWFQVQDEAAQIVTRLLNPRPGETVLDACAGLGGKTGHIAQMMKNSGRILAVDTERAKIDKLMVEMNRLGVSIVETRALDLEKPLPRRHREPFDRVLLDAPCSGLGVIRRNPDAKWKASEKDQARYRGRQIRLLTGLAPLVKPGGVMVYAVCSTEPEENESVVKGFLNKRHNFAIEKRPAEILPGVASLIDEDGFLITHPHLHDMDGFFSVRLRRIK